MRCSLPADDNVAQLFVVIVIQKMLPRIVAVAIQKMLHTIKACLQNPLFS